MSYAERVIRAAKRACDRAGKVTVTLSREIDTLSDERPGKGEPVPVEASGVHALSATTLTIAPQATWIFRGGVSSGAVIAIAGHATSYATTAAAAVDHTSPGTLALTITPGLEAALVGAEVVTITEAAAVSYPDSRKVSDKEATKRGWSVPTGSSVYLVVHSGLRRPEPGDIVTAPWAASLLNVDGSPFDYSHIQIGSVQ